MVWLIDNLCDLGLAIASYISQAVQLLLSALFYPVQLVFYWVGHIVNSMYLSFVGLVSAFYSTFSMFYDFLVNHLFLFFPSAWTFIIMIGFTLVFLLRIYSFVKDISIAGFKI